MGEQDSWEEYRKKSKARLFGLRIAVNLAICAILALALYLIQLTVVTYSENEDSLKR